MRNARKCGRIFYMWGEIMGKIAPDYDKYFSKDAYPFTVGKRYVYFSSLKYTKSKGGQYSLKNAKSYLNSKSGQLNISKTNSKTQTNMDKALAFLLKAADYERQKEEQLIELFLKRFPDKIPPGIAEVTDNYLKLIIKLNGIIKTIPSFKQQIDQENDRIKERKDVENQAKQAVKNISDSEERKKAKAEHINANIQNDFSVGGSDKYGTSTTINSIFNNNSNVSVISEIITEEYAKKLFTFSNNTLQLTPAQSLVLQKALIDKVRQLYVIQKGREFSSMGIKKNYEEYKDEIRQLITKENGEFQKFFAAIESTDENSLISALQSIAESMGMNNFKEDIKNIDEKISIIKERLFKAYEKENPNGSWEDYMKWLESIGTTEEYLQNLYKTSQCVSVQPYYTSEQITLMELISNHIYGVLGGTTNPTDDYLAGKLFFTFTENEDIQKEVSKVEKKLQQERDKAFSKIQKTEDLSSYNQNIDTLRQLRAQQQKIIQQGLKDINTIEENIDFFLSNVNIHGSIKGYMSVGNENTDIRGLQGASFGKNVLEQLSIIKVTMQDIFTDMDINWLLFAMLNAGSQAIGTKNKRSLEDYFSTMIGFLMFNDGQMAVEDVVETINITNSGSYDIHLYTINGIYIPNSFILQKTYDALMGVSTDIIANAKGIKATLTTYNGGPINPDISLELSDWDTTSNEALSITKLDMHFLAGMIDVVEAISNAMKNF